MSTLTTNLGLGVPAPNDSNYPSVLTSTFTTLDAQSALGALACKTTETPSTTLNVAISAGTFRSSTGTIVSYAGATQGMTANSTNYIYLTDAGVLTVNTTGFPANTFHVRIATVVASNTSITSITDSRLAWVSSGNNAGSALYLPLAGGTMGDPANIVLGTGTGTQIGTAANQKLGVYGATPVVQAANTSDIKTAIVNFGIMAGGGSSPLNLGTALVTASFLVNANSSVADGVNIALGTTTGTQIGTATTQKIGLWGVTPITQPGASTELRTLLINVGLLATGGANNLNLNGGTLTANSGILNSISTPGSPSDGQFWYDSVRKTFMMFVDGVSTPLGGAAFVQTNTTTVGNAASGTLQGTGIGSLTLPSNFLVVGRAIRVRLGGYINTKASGAGNLTLQVTLGGTQIATTGTFAVTANIANGGWTATIDLVCIATGSVSTINAAGEFNINGTMFASGLTSAASISTSASEGFVENVTWSVSDPANTISQTICRVESLG